MILLLNRVLMTILGKTADLAQTGTETPCAAGFVEWARDIGPCTFLLNHSRDYDIYDTQLQVYGHPVYTGGLYYSESGWNILGIKFDLEYHDDGIHLVGQFTRPYQDGPDFPF